MALGVDGVAHRAALDVDGYTIAVLGCGIDRVYPREHKNLYGEIIRRGTVLTEFCPGAAPIAHNFPIRNRIISGMSTATVVIEADERSGALITAKDAKRQGRAVYALPGNVGALGSSGTNKLLLEGAKMVTSALDILDEYKDEYAKHVRQKRRAVLSPPRIKGREQRRIEPAAGRGKAAEAVPCGLLRHRCRDCRSHTRRAAPRIRRHR